MFWNLGLKPWAVVDAYCDTVLGDKALLARLRETKFDVSIVDMIYNECGLALAHHLDAALPTVGFWAFSFISGEPGEWIDSSCMAKLLTFLHLRGFSSFACGAF